MRLNVLQCLTHLINKQSNMTKTETIKELQCLYAWASFYAQNNQWDSYNKCDIQIAEFKTKNNLH